MSIVTLKNKRFNMGDLVCLNDDDNLGYVVRIIYINVLSNDFKNKKQKYYVVYWPRIGESIYYPAWAGLKKYKL